MHESRSELPAVLSADIDIELEDLRGAHHRLCDREQGLGGCENVDQ